MEYQKEYEFAKRIARRAGEIMKQYYRTDQQVERKHDNSPVTIADKTINSFLIEEVQREFPEHGVLGEEESWNNGRYNMWVCDPIDGTRMYSYHIPISMFSLAYVVDGEPVVSVCYNPWTDDLYEARKGGGAWRNGKKISVASQNPEVVGTWVNDFRGKAADLILEKGWHPTLLYPFVFKGCLIAEGSLSGQATRLNSTHDAAAVVLLVQEAGGRVTDINGNIQRYDSPMNGCVMSNGVIHEELLDLIHRAST